MDGSTFFVLFFFSEPRTTVAPVTYQGLYMKDTDNDIKEALNAKLNEWSMVGKDFAGLTKSSKHFKIVDFVPEPEHKSECSEHESASSKHKSKRFWIIVESDIYPPYNILDYGVLLKGVTWAIENGLVIKNGAAYSSKVEHSPIDRKTKYGTTSVSILTKYYRVLHMAFVKWYTENHNK